MKRKFGKKRSYADFLSILLVITIIAILSLVGYLAYKVINEKTVEANASASNDEFLAIAEENRKMLEKEQEQEQEQEENGNLAEENSHDKINEIIDEIRNETASTEENQKKNPQASVATPQNIKKAYMGNYEIKGSISIPKTKCNYPILEKVTPDSLKKSVGILDIVSCKELGVKVKDLNVPGTNSLILGHNYLNGQFFSNNDKLVIGDTIQITDQVGLVVTYTIYNMFYTTPEDVSFMERDIDVNTREITLQTCNENSSQRLIIFAKDN